MNPWILIAALGFFAVLFAAAGKPFVRAPRGRRLTTTTLDSLHIAGANDNDGVFMRLAPVTLAAIAEANLKRPVDPEAYALARMLASEGGTRDNAIARRARAWVARNDALSLRKGHPADHDKDGKISFVELFSFSTHGSRDRFFGKQISRRYSTAADPWEGDLVDAEWLLRDFETNEDPTRGATKFVDADALGAQGGTEGKTIASLEADWKAKGELLPGAGRPLYLFREVA